MTKWILTRRRGVLATFGAAALVLAPTLPDRGTSLPALVGGGFAGAALWGCGVCAGTALTIVTSGMASVVAFLALSTNLYKITACISVCAAALG